MQPRDPRQLADALTRLRGSASYGHLANHVYYLTDGEVDFDSLWLYRVANGKVESLRKLGTSHEAVLFVLALMVHACRDGQAPEQVGRLGYGLLENLLGSKRLAGMVLEDIGWPTPTTPSGSDHASMLERQLLKWLTVAPKGAAVRGLQRASLA